MLTAPARKAVNIVAMGSSRNDFIATQLAENRPPLLVDAETWTINYMAAAIYCDRIIHVDPIHAYEGHPVVREFLQRALKNNIPFYTSWPHPKYPNHVVYPFDRVLQTLGVAYLNTSVAYAIALAMADGFNEIGLFGCDFSYPNVHVSESGRACCEFLMGIGSQRGIKFAIASSSTLMDMHTGQQPYGFFANPLAPPVNGGKLMSVPEILQHVERMRTPATRPNISPVNHTVPLVINPLPKVASFTPPIPQPWSPQVGADARQYSADPGQPVTVSREQLAGMGALAQGASMNPLSMFYGEGLPHGIPQPIKSNGADTSETALKPPGG